MKQEIQTGGILIKSLEFYCGDVEELASIFSE